MLWQYLYLLLTIVILCVESKVPKAQRRLFKKYNGSGKLAKSYGVARRRPQITESNRQPSLRIRNEDPQQQGEETPVQIRGSNVTGAQNLPYMAAILINGKVWCAGSIVSDRWVLTAAHCLNFVIRVAPSKNLYQYVKVRVGSSKADDGGTLIDVVGTISHPKYEIEPVPHADVALLRLADYLEFHKFVNQISMYEDNIEPYAQSFIEVSGWGATRGAEYSFHEHSSDMLTARLKVRPQQYCVDTYQLVDGFQFTNDFFCASLRNGTRDACLFDAGAPAVQKNQLMGIMSFGPEKCGHSFQPAVFIKTFYFRDFVNSVIEEYEPKTPKNKANAVIKELESDKLQLSDSEYGQANIMLLSNEEKEPNKQEGNHDVN